MPDTYTQSVAAEIRAEMGRQNLRQWQLALLASMSPQYLNRRLNGRVSFSTDDIELIASALGISIAELASPRRIAS